MRLLRGRSSIMTATLSVIVPLELPTNGAGLAVCVVGCRVLEERAPFPVGDGGCKCEFVF